MLFKTRLYKNYFASLLSKVLEVNYILQKCNKALHQRQVQHTLKPRPTSQRRQQLSAWRWPTQGTRTFRSICRTLRTLWYTLNRTPRRPTLNRSTRGWALRISYTRWPRLTIPKGRHLALAIRLTSGSTKLEISSKFRASPTTESTRMAKLLCITRSSTRKLNNNWTINLFCSLTKWAPCLNHKLTKRRNSWKTKDLRNSCWTWGYSNSEYRVCMMGLLYKGLIQHGFRTYFTFRFQRTSPTFSRWEWIILGHRPTSRPTYHDLSMLAQEW